MRNSKALIVFASIAVSATGCLRPTVVTDAAGIASLRLAVMDAQATRQLQLVNTQRATLAQSISVSRERAQEFGTLSEDWPLIWRVRLSETDKANTRFLTEVRVQDEALTADPYLLVRKPPPPIQTTATADVGGLGVARKALQHLGGERALSPKEVAAFLFDIAGNVELTKKPAVKTSDPGAAKATP